MNLQELTDLLETFPYSAPKAETPATYLEISGYPHLENVASNILKFFVDSQEVHQLYSLFLQSLLEAAGIQATAEDLQIEDVQREEYTVELTRLDLVISTQTLIVGVENKLFHGLNNDFKIYEKHLRTKADQRATICILLTLHPVEVSPRLGAFIPVTYSAFFEKIRNNLGQFAVEANPRYLPFLFDFMQTLEHFQQENTVDDSEFRGWVAKNQEEITNLLSEIRRFKSNLRNQVKLLQAQIDVDKHNNSGVKISPWLYDPADLSVRRFLVYDFVLPDGLKFALDIILASEYWKITVVRRKPTTMRAIDDFFGKIQGISYRKTAEDGEERPVIGEIFDYMVDKAILGETVQDLIDQIVAHAVKGRRIPK
ncbi:PD-(D/E)XK nuclease family protein [Chloroflexota bacterium]